MESDRIGAGTREKGARLDPDNPVVKLCVAGMQAEAEGRFQQARDLFEQAWAASQDDFEACVAAHYLARHQESPAEMLRWNRAALEHARSAGDDRVRGFYPSLYLNLGWSHESLGDREEAGRFYDLAARCLDELPAGPYRDTVEDGIRAGQKRIAAGQTGGDRPPGAMRRLHQLDGEAGQG
jgi:tetratricopeptide (TPR) repeat protein